jgi:hypothetical protein
MPPLLTVSPTWHWLNIALVSALSAYGYHSDDGCVFHGDSSKGRDGQPTWGVGDVIGVGVDAERSQIYWYSTLTLKINAVVGAGQGSSPLSSTQDQERREGGRTEAGR